MEGDREAVRFVAGAFQQLASRGSGGQPERVGGAGQPDLLLALGQRRVGEVAESQVAERGGRRGELAPAAVEQDQVGEFLPLGQHPAVAAEHHLPHRGVVVRLAGGGADAELPVGGRERLAPFDDHHRGDDLLPLEVGDVEGLDPVRGRGEPERLPERPDARRRFPPGFPEVEVEGQPGVAADQVHHPPAAALDRYGDLDAGAALFAEPVRDQLAFREVERGLDAGRRPAPQFVELLHG